MRTHFGLVGGWIIGMLIQLTVLHYFFPKVFHSSPLWWTVQLIGLGIMTLICIILDRKAILVWFSRKDWGAITKGLSSMGESIIKWLKS